MSLLSIFLLVKCLHISQASNLHENLLQRNLELTHHIYENGLSYENIRCINRQTRVMSSEILKLKGPALSDHEHLQHRLNIQRSLFTCMKNNYLRGLTSHQINFVPTTKEDTMYIPRDSKMILKNTCSGHRGRHFCCIFTSAFRGNKMRDICLKLYCPTQPNLRCRPVPVRRDTVCESGKHFCCLASDGRATCFSLYCPGVNVKCKTVREIKKKKE